MEKQKDLNGCWAIIRKEIKRSKIKRISWKKTLGMSLNKKVAILKGIGMDSQMVYQNILSEKSGLNYEQKRRLKIGICARFGEQGIVDNVNKRT
jgi:predicted nucleic acid-binding Zn ribbon protein